MAVTGIVLRQNLPRFEVVNTFYAAAPHEPTERGLLPVDRVDVFGVSFHGLINAIIAKKRSHVVIVAHGSREIGLHIPVDSTTDVSIGSGIALLLKVVDSLEAAGGKTADAETLRACVSDSKLPESTVLRIAKKCLTIRQAPALAVAVHIRGCEIGADLKHLRNFQRMFRSAVVSAPKCPMLYSLVRPLGSGRGPVSDVEVWGRSNPVLGRRFIYRRTGMGPMLLDLQYLGDTAQSQAAVQARADIKNWAAVFHQNANTPSVETFPIAALYPPSSQNYFLPHEPKYLELIASVTA